MSTPTYHAYVSDAEHMKEYSDYQKRYATQIRESDRLLIERVREIVRTQFEGKTASLLDIGCSTGNLLLHLKRLLPNLELAGGDMAEGVIEECRQNPELEGIRFEVMDVLDLPEAAYDIVIANAMVCVLGEAEFNRAFAEIRKALKPGGWFLVFDWFHPWQQQVTITEVTRAFPEGFTFHWRGFARVQDALTRAGFETGEFTPFQIPVELPKPEDPSVVQSYTVDAADGSKLVFRGVLCQPWCHMAAQRAD